MKSHIWIIDDEPGICASLKLALKNDYEVRTFESAQEALSLLGSARLDGVLLDQRLKDSDGLEVLKTIKAYDPEIAIIMMTAYGDIGSSVEAMRAGAFTYLTKPLDVEELQLIVAQALSMQRMNERISYLEDALIVEHHFEKIIGESASMQRVYRMIDRLKDVDAGVLITGESGTGKELAARAIHEAGRRAEESFVVVNCAAIPENLLESEFFGHSKGAFTGATADRKGKFELADRGTIFLDEIGDMPLSLQGKLLRTLQDGEFSPVGSTGTRHVDVRVIAATNRDLQGMIARKEFRQDLYYRLNVMELKMPPLKERTEDIPLLCEHFLQRFSKEMKKNIRGITEDALEKISSHDYPGNVRQLANILEYATILCQGDLIGVGDLPEEITGRRQFLPTDTKRSEKTADAETVDHFLCSVPLKETEKRAIAATLRKNNGRRDKSAADLGISVRSLQNKIHEYDLH